MTPGLTLLGAGISETTVYSASVPGPWGWKKANHMSHIYIEGHMRDLRMELGRIYSVLKLIVIILYVTFKLCGAWR